MHYTVQSSIYMQGFNICVQGRFEQRDRWKKWTKCVHTSWKNDEQSVIFIKITWKSFGFRDQDCWSRLSLVQSFSPCCSHLSIYANTNTHWQLTTCCLLILWIPLVFFFFCNVWSVVGPPSSTAQLPVWLSFCLYCDKNAASPFRGLCLYSV